MSSSKELNLAEVVHYKVPLEVPCLKCHSECYSDGHPLCQPVIRSHTTMILCDLEPRKVYSMTKLKLNVSSNNQVFCLLIGLNRMIFN